ncbi:MAG: hypothetical protein LPK45_00720, partial [Bacteroidota bacterium]|nr:hypothetical protein [Bacteroidota bacterium]MDX5429547.1 hypothetical protein [Bacteroidota bacterium]MDX5468334.1 hypothetical protein [Bacteroidota bacterium]
KKGLIQYYKNGDNFELRLKQGKGNYLFLILPDNKIAFKPVQDVKPVGGKVEMIPVSRSFASGKEVKEYIYRTLGL